MFIMAGSQVVKLTAKTALKNNWLKIITASAAVLFEFILLSLLSAFVGFIANDIAADVFFLLLAVLLLCPMIFGLIRFVWRFIYGADDSPITVFWYFTSKKLYLRGLHMTAAIVLRAVVFGFILFLPANVVKLFSGTYVYDLLDMPTPLWVSNLEPVIIFLKVTAGVILFFIMLRYYLAPFLAAADEDMEISEAVHMSSVLARHTTLDFIYLAFSFLGWIALSLFMFPLVFTLPYFVTAYCVHARFAVAEYNKHIEISNAGAYPSYSAGV